MCLNASRDTHFKQLGTPTLVGDVRPEVCHTDRREHTDDAVRQSCLKKSESAIRKSVAVKTTIAVFTAMNDIANPMPQYDDVQCSLLNLASMRVPEKRCYVELERAANCFEPLARHRAREKHLSQKTSLASSNGHMPDMGLK